MGGIQGINPVYSSLTSGQVAPTKAAAGQVVETGGLSQATGASSILSLSSTSISATNETLLSASSTPMLASNEAIGAALLLLILQYMQSSDTQEKQDLANMITALAGMQQQNQGGEMLFYSSSSVSVESTQMMISTSQGLSAYSGAAAELQQAPSVDAGSAGLDVVA